MIELLGQNKRSDLKDDRTQFDLSFERLSIFEKNFYLPPNEIFALTDRRVIEVVQLRPIDFLANILQGMARMEKDEEGYYENIEDLIEQFGIREVCALLLQFCADPKELYFFSRRINSKQDPSKRKQQLLQPKHSLASQSFIGSRSQFYNVRPNSVAKFNRSIISSRQDYLQQNPTMNITY